MTNMTGEYTVDTADLIAPANGMVKLSNYATAYGTVAIEEWYESLGAYKPNAEMIYTSEEHLVLTLTPYRKHRIVFTGGTGAILTLAHLPTHTA